jgi:hypothetical protein
MDDDERGAFATGVRFRNLCWQYGLEARLQRGAKTVDGEEYLALAVGGLAALMITIVVAYAVH